MDTDTIVPDALPAAETMSTVSPESAGMTADEIALYDRQIRLWGVQAQERLRNAKILLITMKALANEVAKNLVLAGIGSLTVLDHELVKEEDLGAQFFISEEDVGTNRAQAAAPQIQKLNPRVRVIVDTDNISSKSPRYFEAFDIIVATDLNPNALNIINTATRIIHKPFYAAGVHGIYGFIFSDLIQHEYAVEREKGNKATVPGEQETRTRKIIGVQTKVENRSSGKVIEIVTKQEVYSTWLLASSAAKLPAEYVTKTKRRLKAVTPLLSCFRALWEFLEVQNGRLPGHGREDLELFTTFAQQKHKALGLPTETLRSEFLRSFLQNLGSEIAPVTAQLGGQLAQDVINVLGRRQQPIQNMVLFDGDSLTAPMYALHPDGDLGEGLLPESTELESSIMLNGAAQPPVSNGATNGFLANPSELITID